MSSRSRDRKRIGVEQYTRAYKIGRRFCRGEVSITKAGHSLEREGMNYSSATDIVMGLRHLLKGERYTRTMSDAATHDFLTWILRDYGPETLGQALQAVAKHLAYYEGKFSKRPGLHRVLDEHRHILGRHERESSGSDVFVSPEEEPSNKKMREGRPKTMKINVYERSRKARDACIAKYSPVCSICGFDFETTFGVLGKGFIHVHHLKNLSSIGKDYVVDPVKDLRPICPNCHAMVHRGTHSYGLKRLDEIRDLIVAAKQYNQGLPK